MEKVIAMGDVFDYIEGVIDSVSDVLDDVVDSVLGGIDDILDDITDAVGLKASTLIRIIRSSFSKLYHFLGYLSNTLGNFISAPLSYMGKIFEAVLSSVVGNLFNAMDWLWRGFGQLKGLIIHKFKWVQDRLSSLYDLIAHPTASFIKKVADAVSDYFGATISWLTNTVKSLYRKVAEYFEPTVSWLKDKVTSLYKKVTEYFEPEISWVKQQISSLYNIYNNKISPLLAKITDTIHKVAVLTEVYKDITEGKLFEAFLEGMSIADEELAKKVANIAKAWDGTAKGLLKALGYTSGHISHILHDVESNVNRMLKDVEEIIENTGLESLEFAEDVLRFINEDIAQRLDDMLSGQNSLLKSIIYTITDPAVEAYMIVEDTVRDYHKYEPLVRAAELRKYNAITPRPYFPVILIPPFGR